MLIHRLKFRMAIVVIRFIWGYTLNKQLLRWQSGQEPACQCRRHNRHGFALWARKMPWRRARHAAPVFLPGKSHGQRTLVGYSLCGHKRDRHDFTTKQQHALGCEKDWETMVLYNRFSFIDLYWKAYVFIVVYNYQPSCYSSSLVIIPVNHLSSGCYNRLPLTGWLKQQTVTFYSSGGGQSEIRVPAWLGWILSSRGLSLVHVSPEGEIKISLPLFIKVLTPA